MFKILRNSLLLCVFAAGAFAASEENVSRQIEVSPDGKLIVDVDFGSIDIVSASDDMVSLQARRELDVRDEAKEKQYFADAPITLTKEGNVVTVRARNLKSHGFQNEGHCSMNASYTVRIPKKFETDLQTEGGDISIANLAANAKAKTSGGKLIFKQLEGALTATTRGGPIDMQNCRGSIDVETRGGDIKAIDGAGTLHVQTEGGRIDVRNFSGDTEARTSGGDVVLERVTGKIVGQTSGGSIRASVAGVVTGDVDLETSAGNIDLALPTSATIDVVAHTSIGRVVNRLPLEVSDLGEEHLRGRMNGGGKSVSLQTSAGNITIKPGSEIVQR